MNNRIKAAFNSVYASEELKASTRAYIAQRSRNYAARKTENYLKIIPAAAVIIVLFAGIKLYFTPTTHINIDITPSLALGINRFDRVVSVKALNDDGKKLMETLDIRFTAYDEALRRILDNKSVEAMLSEDGIMTVTVVETNSAQSESILSAAKECVGGYGNVHCHSVSNKDASEASKLGLSYERYLMYLNLQAADPKITPESIRNISMYELHKLTEMLYGIGEEFNDHNEHNSYTESNCSSAAGTGHHGEDHGHGHG